ncbi:MAG: leucine-rich repeat domain-containing protein [Clostridia bacterium]|nr:leucine-rich repeat domain-containing protein [Clostridia bacterium]
MKKLRTVLLILVLIGALAFALSSCVMGGTGSGEDEPDPTAGVLYEISEDGTYVSVVGYTGEDSNVVISSTYEELPVTHIADGAFDGLKTIVSVSIPDTVTHIGDHALRGLEWIEELVLPDSIEAIGAGAFEGCSALKEVYIHGGLSEIGEDAFKDCEKLSKVYFFEEIKADISRWVKIKLGNDTSSPLYYADEFYFNYYPVTSVVLDNSVKSIPRYALSFKSLTSLTVPTSVNSIAQGALEECKSIEAISLPFVGGGTAESGYLGYIFGAESYTYNNQAIPDSLKEITLTGSGAIPDYAFFGARCIQRINFGEGIDGIGKYAFKGCLAFTTLAVPQSVKSIGLGAFEGCDNLASISLPSIGENLYLGYFFGAQTPDKSSVMIPQSLKSAVLTTGEDVPAGAFYGASGLTSIAIEGATASIGLGAFEGCSSLKSLSVPFAGGKSNENTYFGYLFGADDYSKNGEFVPSSLELVTLTSTATITSHAFAGCASLKSVALPMGITVIGANAFEGCSSLSAMLIPYTVTSVGSGAFAGCGSTKLLVMHRSTPTTWNTSWNPDGAQVVYSAPYVGKTADGLIYTQRTSRVSITGYEGTSSTVTIPDAINGYKVTSIGEDAFKDNTVIEKVIISENVIQIAANAFYSCYNLTEVAIPSKVTRIDACAFYGCGISEIIIPKSVEKLGISALSYCPVLTKVTIEDGSALNLIDAQAFRGSSALEELYISDLAFWCGISFGDEDSNPLLFAKKLFVGGEQISCAIIPEGVTSIGKYTFKGTAIRAIVLPKSLVSIESNAFNGSTALTSIYLHSGIETIGDSPFMSCPRLTIFCQATEVPTGWDANWNYANRPVYFGSAESGITEDGFVWARIDDSRIMVCGYVGSAESITVPSAINSTPVTAISQSAFRDNATVVSVTVPESVVLIERDAFNGCSALSRVVLLSAEGWRYTSTATSTGGTEFLPEQLTDPALIAEYLRSTHAKYYWKK